MEELIIKVIAKVRDMYKYIPELNELLKQGAEVKIEETEEGLHIKNISFSYYGKILVGEKSIIFFPDQGEFKTLATYKNFEALLEDKICLS